MSPRPGMALPAPAVALRLAVGMALWFIATAGGRITASDEYTMYRLTESIVTRGSVAVVAGTDALPGDDDFDHDSPVTRRASPVGGRPSPERDYTGDSGMPNSPSWSTAAGLTGRRAPVGRNPRAR